MRKLLIFLLRLYKKAVSEPLALVLGGGCRFNPTCSEYAVYAIEKFGISKGGALALKRLARCHPFTQSGIFDPLPEN